MAGYHKARGDIALQPTASACDHEPSTDLGATYQELSVLGATIAEPLERKPWGLRQFTVEDLDGKRFYFHCD